MLSEMNMATPPWGPLLAAIVRIFGSNEAAGRMRVSEINRISGFSELIRFVTASLDVLYPATFHATISNFGCLIQSIRLSLEGEDQCLLGLWRRPSLPSSSFVSAACPSPSCCYPILGNR